MFLCGWCIRHFNSCPAGGSDHCSGVAVEEIFGCEGDLKLGKPEDRRARRLAAARLGVHHRSQQPLFQHRHGIGRHLLERRPHSQIRLRVNHFPFGFKKLIFKINLHVDRRRIRQRIHHVEIAAVQAQFRHTHFHLDFFPLVDQLCGRDKRIAGSSAAFLAHNFTSLRRSGAANYNPVFSRTFPSAFIAHGVLNGRSRRAFVVQRRNSLSPLERRPLTVAREILPAAGAQAASSRGESLRVLRAMNRKSPSPAACAKQANPQSRAPRLLSSNAVPHPETRFFDSPPQHPQSAPERASQSRSNVATTNSPWFLPAGSSDWRCTRAAPSIAGWHAQFLGSRDSAGCWCRASLARAKSNRRRGSLQPLPERRARASDSTAICESATCSPKSSFRREPSSRFPARLRASRWRRSREKSARESPALCWKRAPLP